MVLTGATMPSADTFFLAATMHGVFLIAILLSGRSESIHANRLLSLLVALITLSLWNIYVYKVGLSKNWLLIDYILWATPFLWGPVLWYYVRCLIKNAPISLNKKLLHCAPSIIIGLAQIPFYYLGTSLVISTKISEVIFMTVMISLYLQMMGYIIWSVIEVQRYQDQLKQALSATEKINLSWLKILITIFAILVLIDMCLAVPTRILQIANPYYNVYMMAEALTIFAIGYLSLRQIEIQEPLEEEHCVKKYDSSPISIELGRNLAQDLDKKMQNSEIYLKNNLSLSELSKEMGLSPHHLSQVINQHRNKNFYDYVNAYRAQKAAETLMINGKVNVTNLAYDTGFNNRVSFNNAFRKHTGTTPTKYAKKFQPELVS